MDSRYVALFLLLAVTLSAQQRDADFSRLADRFFDEVYFKKYDPVSGTAAGFHQYDALLGLAVRGARRSTRRCRTALKKFEGEVEGFGAQGLSAAASSDRDLLLGADSRAAAFVRGCARVEKTPMCTARARPTRYTW